MAVCALMWDLETNAGTALLVSWPSLTLQLLAVYEAQGIPFALAHEVSDLLTGAVLVPLIIFYASRFARPRNLARNP